MIAKPIFLSVLIFSNVALAQERLVVWEGTPKNIVEDGKSVYKEDAVYGFSLPKKFFEKLDFAHYEMKISLKTERLDYPAFRNYPLDTLIQESLDTFDIKSFSRYDLNSTSYVKGKIASYCFGIGWADTCCDNCSESYGLKHSLQPLSYSGYWSDLIIMCSDFSIDLYGITKVGEKKVYCGKCLRYEPIYDDGTLVATTGKFNLLLSDSTLNRVERERLLNLRAFEKTKFDNIQLRLKGRDRPTSVPKNEFRKYKGILTHVQNYRSSELKRLEGLSNAEQILGLRELMELYMKIYECGRKRTYLSMIGWVEHEIFLDEIESNTAVQTTEKVIEAIKNIQLPWDTK